jgi:hypothetical protein
MYALIYIYHFIILTIYTILIATNVRKEYSDVCEQLCA